MLTPDYQDTVRNVTKHAQMPLVQMVQDTQRKFKCLLSEASEGNSDENKNLARLVAADVTESVLVKRALEFSDTETFKLLDTKQRAIQMKLFLADEVVGIVMSKASNKALDSVIPACIDKFLTPSA